MSRDISQSNMSTVISIVVSTLGTGILAMSSSFSLLGYGYAIISLLISTLCLYYSLYSLVYASIETEMIHDCSYSKLGDVFSTTLKNLINLSIVGSNFGTVVYIVKQFVNFSSQFVFNIYPILTLDKIRSIMLAFIILVSFFFFIQDDISVLRFIQKISFFCVVYYLILVIYYGCAHGKNLDKLSVRKNDNIIDGFINFVFALHCQFSFLNIYSSMKDKSLINSKKILVIASLAVGIVYGISGFFGYKAVGDEIKKDLTLKIFMDQNSTLMKNLCKNSFDSYGILPKLCVLSFLFIWFGTIVFCSYQVIDIIREFVAKLAIIKNPSRFGVSIFYSISLLIIGYNDKLDIKSFLDVAAALFTNPLSFFFPALFNILVTKKFTANKLAAHSLLGFSIIIAIKMIYDKCQLK